MNIFYLDSDPVICATYHADKHVVKMILEYAQLLCTVHHLCDDVLDGAQRVLLYRCTHQNHPSALWVRQSHRHYDWLYQLFICLCDEYTHRYGKVHLTDKKLRTILKICPVSADLPFIMPPQVMPDEYRCDDTVQAYREYYRHAKKDMLAFRHRPSPSWLNQI
ncbi:MAG: pyrimidine dimer DNA glycosylase/endonuclease V [Moraxella sp.]|nr:pyrimidine dimer DNA glycosylase/endonuclease V [Moraxella sp.]